MRYELTLPGAVITCVGLAAETRRAACTHIPVSREDAAFRISEFPIIGGWSVKVKSALLLSLLGTVSASFKASSQQ